MGSFNTTNKNCVVATTAAANYDSLPDDKPGECKTGGCATGYSFNTTNKNCVVSTVTNCATLPDDKPGECTTCKTGFVLKKDKTKCDALPTGCAVATVMLPSSARCAIPLPLTMPLTSRELPLSTTELLTTGSRYAPRLLPQVVAMPEAPARLLPSVS